MQPLDVNAIRKHFSFPAAGRVATNNAATTQPPNELVELFHALAPDYENVHRGQSGASKRTTALLEDSYDTIARFINAPSRRNIIIHRNTTEAINAVMYMLMTEFRDGDNIVATLMEHNSNYIPWHGLCREILPRFGVRVELRLAKFDPATGELDLAHLATLVDSKTKLVCCSGASNFFGTKNPLPEVRLLSHASGYVHDDGTRGSFLLVDGAQLVPSTQVDVKALDVDFLTFSFHKMLAPFGVGVLYAKEAFLRTARPFLYGGDMVAEGQVRPDEVAYGDLPWKFSAGTPNILGTIASGQALRLLLDLTLYSGLHCFFRRETPIGQPDVREAMRRITSYTRRLTHRAYDALSRIKGIQIYGPKDAVRRTPLISFNLPQHNPMDLADALASVGVEARGGCHCSTLAHRALGLNPPASCRLSFYFYNTEAEVDYATAAVDAIARGVSLRRERPLDQALA